MQRHTKLVLAFTVMAFVVPLTGMRGDDSYFESAMKYFATGMIAAAVISRLDARRGQGRQGAAAPAAPAAPRRPRAGETRQVIDVHLERGVVLERALAAVSAIRRAQVRSVDRDAGTISAVTGPTLRSPGEKIEVSLADRGDGRLQVEIASLSKLFAASADREKNEENVRLIAEAIQLGP